jgi:hypothetical protein
LFGVDGSWSLFLPIWISFTCCNGNECGVLSGPELFCFSCSACCCRGVDCAVTVHRRRGVADNPTSKDRLGLFKNYKQTKKDTKHHINTILIRQKCKEILSPEKIQKYPHNKYTYQHLLFLQSTKPTQPHYTFVWSLCPCAKCAESRTHLWWTELQWFYRWCFNWCLQWIHIGDWEIWTHSCIILGK